MPGQWGAVGSFKQREECSAMWFAKAAGRRRESGEKQGQETGDETGMVTQAGSEWPRLRAWLWGGRGSPGGRGR